MPAPATPHFSDRLADAIDRAGSPACVGLDPVFDRLPDQVRRAGANEMDAIAAYCKGILDACRPHAAVVKFQSACFERYGGAGVEALGLLIRSARDSGFIVILDAKRADIGITAEHYAHAAFADADADALTVSGYLGPDTVEPFLRPGRGAFVLVRTSNPGSDSVQSHRLADGRTVAEMMADMVAGLGSAQGCVGRRGLCDVGAVVAATKPADAASLRRRMPDQFFLVPGYGAQGGTPADCRSLLRPYARSAGETGVLITASRSVIYAFQPGDPQWKGAVAAAAREFSRELRSLIPGKPGHGG